MHNIKRVICLGSWQGGDATAWLLADHLEARLGPEVEIYRCASPAQMPEFIKLGVVVCIIDATPDLPSGQVKVIYRHDLVHTPHYSSHGVDLLAALNLIDALGDTPSTLHIIALGTGTQAAEADTIANQIMPKVLEMLHGVLGSSEQTVIPE